MTEGTLNPGINYTRHTNCDGQNGYGPQQNYNGQNGYGPQLMAHSRTIMARTATAARSNIIMARAATAIPSSSITQVRDSPCIQLL